MLLAEEWGLPPWGIEKHLSVQWADRWIALREVRQSRGQGKSDIGQTVTLPDGTKQTRVI